MNQADQASPGTSCGSATPKDVQRKRFLAQTIESRVGEAINALSDEGISIESRLVRAAVIMMDVARMADELECSF